MGIKDNFSQAVKELWKKDGLEENGENKTDKTAQPTELDRYLQQPDQQEMNAQAQQPAQFQQTAPAQQESAPVQQPAQQVQQPQAPQQQAQFQPNQSAQPANGYQYDQGRDMNSAGVSLETPYYRDQNAQNNTAQNVQNMQNNQPRNFGAVNNGYNPGGFGGNGGNGGYVPPVPPAAPGQSIDAPSDTDEVTVISRNTIIDGNVRSLANMQVDGNIKGNVETTRDIEMSGKVVGDIKCNNANMNSAAMQGNLNLKGKIRMDRDTILIGDLSSQYADVNGRIRGKLEIGGKAELKRDAIVFGDINASTIAVTDGAIIQGYVNTTFLSKEDSRSVFPEAISFDKNTADNKA